MSHSPNPNASRTIRRKAEARKANEEIANAAREAAKAFAEKTLTEQGLMALFATIQRVDG